MRLAKWLLVLVAVLVGLAVFVWPTPYDTFVNAGPSGPLAFRRNRLTGTLEMRVEGVWARTGHAAYRPR